MRLAVFTLLSRADLRSRTYLFDQAAIAAVFRFLRRPSRPNAPRPLAKRGNAPGRGTGLVLRPRSVRVTLSRPLLLSLPESPFAKLIKAATRRNTPCGRLHSRARVRSSRRRRRETLVADISSAGTWAPIFGLNWFNDRGGRRPPLPGHDGRSRSGSDAAAFSLAKLASASFSTRADLMRRCPLLLRKNAAAVGMSALCQ